MPEIKKMGVKMAKSGWDDLRKIAGERGRNGLSTGNAFSVGVKREVVPAHIQELADSIKPVKTAAFSKGAAFQKKYNIEGDTATLTPAMFGDAFAQTGIMNNLKKCGVKKINILSDDVDMVFEIFEAAKNAAEWENIPYINTRDIVTFGVVQAAALNGKVIIHNGREIAGFLRVNSTNTALAKVGTDRNNATFHTSDWGKMGIVNAKSIFNDSATVEEAAFHFKTRGGLRLNHLFENRDGVIQSLEVGKLLYPDLLQKYGVNFDSLRKIQIQHVAAAISSTKATAQDQLISDVFKEVAHGYALYSSTNFNVAPVAVLIPPKKTLG